MWRLTAAGLQLRSIENTSLNDIYEKLAVSVSGLGLSFGKRDYP